MYPEMQVPVSYAGIVSMIISLGTTTSSLMSDRVIRRFNTHAVTAFSVGPDGGGTAGIFHCGGVLAALPLGGSVWSRRRQCGCSAE